MPARFCYDGRTRQFSKKVSNRTMNVTRCCPQVFQQLGWQYATRLAHMSLLSFTTFILLWNAEFAWSQSVVANDTSIVYSGEAAPGKGRHIVLISGDEEYRSEEALPLLARILSFHHGFRCTVLFAIDPETKIIQPNLQTNIPGMEVLQTADLVVLFTRFRNLPNHQMNYLDAYLRSGLPIMGIRTATHAFQLPFNSEYAHYSNGYDGEKTEWHGGFGKFILGEQWVAHHGQHQHEGTRGRLVDNAKQLPILRGLSDGDVWGSTDVYAVELPLAADIQPILLGQVAHRAGKFDERDIHFGMRPTDPVDENDAKNCPMMPIVWTKTYQLSNGKTRRAMMSTIGASADLLQAGTRRLLTNGVYWCLGMEDQIPTEGTKVDIVGTFSPTQFQFRPDIYWQELSLTPRGVVERMAVNIDAGD